jgi:tetratricopeptide (TPR) repeat protein
MRVIIRLRLPVKRGPGLVPQFTLVVAALLLVAGGVYYIIASAYLASAPRRAQAQYQLGMSLAKPGSYAQAIARFGDAIQIRQDFADAYLQRGNAHQALGETGAALADFDRAVALNPRLPDAHNARGIILRDRGEIKSAIEAFTASLKIEPTVNGFYQRGQTYESLGQHQLAISDYDKAIELMTDSPYVYRARALAKRNLGDIEGAEADRRFAASRDHTEH